MSPDDGELGHRGTRQALLEAGVAAEQEPENGDHQRAAGAVAEPSYHRHRCGLLRCE
jgi:hypothetical protein